MNRVFRGNLLTLCRDHFAIKSLFEKMYGHPVSDFYRDPMLWYKCVLDEDKPLVDAGYSALSRGESLQHAVRILHTDGKIRWLETRMVPTLDTEGKLVRLDGVTMDVTDKKNAEQTIQYSIDLLKYVIEHNNGGIAVHDRDLRYVYVSERYLDIYGLKNRDIIGKYHYDVFPDLPEKWRLVHQKALLGEVHSSEEDAYLRSDGTLEWTRWECRPWYDVEGKIGGIIKNHLKI